MGIEADTFETLRRGEEARRHHVPIRIMEELEGAEEIGERIGAAALVHDRRELAGQVLPVGEGK